MNKRELIKLLKANGWEFAHGANHDLATHPGKPGIKIPIPRHAEPNKYTVEGILKEAGLK